MLKRYFSNHQGSLHPYIYSFLKTNRKTLASLIVSFLLIIVYRLTAMTEQINYADSVDLLLASISGGLAHPPGYPLYTFLHFGLLSLFPIEPLEVLVWTNILFQSAAAGLMVFFLQHLFSQSIKKESYLLQIISMLSVLIWGLWPTTWLHSTVVEIFTFTHVFLALWLIWLLPYLKKQKIPTNFDYLSTSLIGGILIFHHALLSIPVVIGYGLLVRSISWRKRIRGSILMSCVTIMMIVVATFTYRLVSKETTYSWPIPTNLASQLRFWSRLVYDYGGSQIETLVTDVSILRIIHSLHMYVSKRMHDVTIVGLLLIALGMYNLWIHRNRAFRFIHFVWIISVPMLIMYLKFPYPSEGEVAYFTGSSLRFRMFYIGDMMEMIFMAGGMAWLSNRSKWTSFITLLLASLVSTQLLWRWPNMDVSRDNFDPIWAKTILESLPSEAVLFIDSDDVFSLLYEQQRNEMRRDVVIVPARFPLQLPPDQLALNGAYPYQDPDKHIAFMIARLLNLDKRVFILSPSPSLLEFLGTEGNPFFAKPHSYTLEISAIPVPYTQAFDYGISIQLANLERANDWWIYGIKAQLANIHTTFMYYFAVSGNEETAQSHKQLAERLYLFDESKQKVGEIFDMARSRHLSNGSFLTYQVPDNTYYLTLGKQQLDEGELDRANYFITRALLLDETYIPAQQLMLAWYIAHGDWNEVEYQQERINRMRSIQIN